MDVRGMLGDGLVLGFDYLKDDFVIRRYQSRDKLCRV